MCWFFVVKFVIMGNENDIIKRKWEVIIVIKGDVELENQREVIISIYIRNYMFFGICQVFIRLLFEW